MAVKQWGWLQVPRGSVNTLDRSTILIGYPFAFTSFIPTDDTTYLRTYLNDPATAPTDHSVTPAAGDFSSGTIPDYLRRWLNDV